jgi:hypothetical protein
VRVELRSPHVVVSQGTTASFEIDVRNDGEVIEGIRTRVIGVDPRWVTADPTQLALFPDSTGTIRVDVDAPAELPAGEMPLTIEVASGVHAGEVVHLDAVLEIRPAVRARLLLEPISLDGYRDATGAVVVQNDGNAPVQLALTGDDAERSMTFTFDPPVIEAGPGERVAADVVVRAPRRYIGSPLMRPFSVVGAGSGTELQASGTFSQRALVPRGVATIGILAAIILVWAVAATLAIGLALRSDDLTKQAPLSFFAPELISSGGGASGGGEGAGGAAARATKGLDPRTVGGEISGTVLATNGQVGIPRMSVEAVRRTPQGVPVYVTAIATDDDGAFTLSGLLPGSYLLRFTAPGFDETWYPGVSSIGAAEPVAVASPDEPAEVSIELEGQPGSLSGRVDLGDPGSEVPVRFSIRPVVDGAREEPIRTGLTASDGTYSVSPVPTPATYEVSFTAPSYQAQTVVQEVGAGEQVELNTVRLTSGLGSIAGAVTAGDEPLGGVTVTAVTGGEEYATATPTSGAIGVFVLRDLPSPATYLLTFDISGYGSETIAVDLGPGQDLSGLAIELAGGTGIMNGRVVDQDGNGLGDVVVTVSGGATTVTGATLTDGTVGAWQVAGLPSAGRYTVTFELEGYTSHTVAVELDPTGATTGVDAALRRALGTITGRVVDGKGSGLGSVEIEVTDGTNVRLTQTADEPRGEFRLGDLPAGAYTVTARTADQERTRLIQLGAGATEPVRIRMGGRS